MLLQVENLSKCFTHGTQTFLAVDHVNFELRRGEMAVLSGPSGCGKSTFFNLLTGVLPADQGRIIFDGQDVTKNNRQAWTKLRSNQLAYILQADSLLHNLTVQENIKLPQRLCGYPPISNDYVSQLLYSFGLAGLEAEYPRSLSGGERRRVAIIRALVQSPLVLIADEPTGDLDPDNARLILEFLRRKSTEGLTVLISSHQLEAIPSGVAHYDMQAGRMSLKSKR